MHGIIQRVFPPGSPQNLNKYQYEYMVLATGDGYAQVPLHHALKADDYGAPDEFSDEVLEAGQKVLVACLRDFSMPFILSAVRNSRKPTDAALGHHSRRRFNAIEVLVDKDKNYSVRSDSGPNVHVKTSSVILDDSAGERITLDRVAKVLTIESNELSVIVKGNASVQVTGNVKLSAAQVDADVKGDCTVKAAKLKADISGSAEISAGSKATVKAPLVDIGKGLAPVVTTLTHPVDYVTGIPIQGVPTVKAG